MNTIAFDTETFYSDDYSVADLGPDRYTADPRFDCYMISVCDGASSWVGHPRDFNWGALVGANLVSHNASFDQAVFRRLCKDRITGLGLACFDAWHCTADLAAYVCNERALANAVKMLYDKDLSKATRSAQKGKSHTREAVQHPDAAMKVLLEYARSDAFWCWKIWNDHSEKWPEQERKLSVLTRECAAYGVQIDLPLLDKYIALAHAALVGVESRLPWVAAGQPPTSPKAFAEMCRFCGIPVPAPKSTDSDAWAAWEEEYLPRHTWIADVSDWRSVNKVLATLKTIKTRLRDDGTIEASLKYFGAHSGRWSGDTGLNFQNFRKTPLEVQGEKIDVRRLIVARPGKKLIISDLAQIEPRVMWTLAGDTESIEAVRKGISTYEVHARQTMGWDGGDLKKDAPATYALAKARVLSLGYGAGWRKLITMAKNYGVELDEKSAKETVASFRLCSPKITSLWRKLGDELWPACRGNLEIGLPGGRTLTYRNVKRTRRTIKTDDGEVINENAFLGWVGKRPIFLYGGLLAENLIQAVARDIFADGLLRVAAAGYRVLFQVHDELIVEADADVPPQTIADLMSQSPAWLRKCPVTAKATESNFYKK